MVLIMMMIWIVKKHGTVESDRERGTWHPTFGSMSIVVDYLVV